MTIVPCFLSSSVCMVTEVKWFPKLISLLLKISFYDLSQLVAFIGHCNGDQASPKEGGTLYISIENIHQNRLLLLIYHKHYRNPFQRRCSYFDHTQNKLHLLSEIERLL